MTKLIALSDGHGMQTAGKRTPTLPSGLKSETGSFMHENEFNRAVIKYLDADLKRNGFKTLLVAPTDADTPLNARILTANKAKVDLYVSVHANANTGVFGTWSGVETYTWGSGESLRIGKIIHKHLLKGSKQKDRGVKDGRHLAEIRDTLAPAVLIEAGFMDNLEEAKLLLSDAYRKETAREIAMAICEAYGVKYKEVAATTSTTAPKPSTVASTSSNQMYRVVVGSYADKKNAEAQIAKLKKAGFDSFIMPYSK